MKPSNILVGLFVIGAVILLIVPIPGELLNVFIIFNIAIALFVLFNALYTTEALEMSTFPTMLLFATVYRLSLNVASTKLILTYGEAGQVIRVFGEFVAGGNFIVGIIVFIVLIIVQFMVITKGAERVAEVSARFTLDAMPGKQMAIDADLNAGLIDDQEAKTRRQKIQQEASFYGAMDGASKFVKGDAIAGILITFINIIGGIGIGIMMNGSSFNEALNNYTILTVGDGLVSQIPALMISLATGILVTKASKDANVGEEIQKQLFSMPRVFMLTGGILILLGILLPLPKILMMGVGSLILFAGYRMIRELKVQSVEEEITEDDTDVEEIRRPENVVSLINVDPIVLEFGYGIIPLADVNQGGDLLDRVVMIRRQIALELGAIVPVIRLRDNIQLNPNEYSINIKGVEVSKGEIMFDHYMAMNPGYIEEEVDGIQTVEPAFGLPALWISESQRERAEALGFTVVDPPSLIATHLTEIIKRNLDELLTREDVQTLINTVKEKHPTLVEELVPKLLSVGEIQKVLMNLLNEGISIRDLVTIFETLADYGASNRDVDILTEYVRQKLKRNISKTFLDNPKNNVITLDPGLEQRIMDSVKQTEQGSYLAIDPLTTQKIYDGLKREVAKVTSTGQQPIVLSSPIVRLYFKRLTENILPDLIVLSYNELDSSVEVQAVGMVKIA
ncbi:flagellar biosynthesis protein FlhA [Vallitalea okinawensis]|uniref:flagellar biosynthesis protein FlhA n=1 Tax=Vallitalea okinawensis TaxID=2078660 RepID=UPI000CFDED1F|nr:flagellar biosynthesis protein FlhA [Vallitalea okinawensis]